MNVQREKIQPENLLDDKNFKSVQMTNELIKNEEVFLQEKIKVENDFDNKEFEVAQINHEFVKVESEQFIDSDDTPSHRMYNACNTVVNFDSTAMQFEGLQTDEYNNRYKVTENCDLIIKHENDEYRSISANTENMSTSTGNEHDFTKAWIKCEAVEELKLVNDLGTETCGVTEITEEYIIKDEDNHMKHPVPQGSYKLHVCTHCNATFRMKRSLDGHIFKKHPDFVATISSRMLLCAHCSYKTTTKEHLANHMLMHAGFEGRYKLSMCIHCNKTFTRKINLCDHIVKKHPEYIASVSTKIHECKYCVYKSTSKRNLSRHMGKHLNARSRGQIKICIHCKGSLNDKSSLDDHIIDKHPEHTATVTSKIHECKYCSLDRHMGNHPEAEGDGQLEVCIHCSRIFKSKVNLHDHIVGNHPGYITTVSSKVHECLYCEYKTTLKSKYANHMLKHPDFTSEVSIKIHECAYCTYKTAFKSSYSRHILKHPGAKSSHKFNVCSHCNARFINKNNLNDHIIKKHPEHIASVSSEIYECTNCTYKTAVKSSFARHMLEQPCTNSSHKLKKCVHCNATFKAKILLDNHTVKKHPDLIASISSKIHECTHCTYKTTFKNFLARHMLKHSDATSSHKVNVCIQCNKTFINKKSLNDHIIKKHPEHYASVSSKIHECTHCSYKTVYKSRLAVHISKHPGAESSYNLKKCVHCEATFRSEKSLDNHIIKNHPEYISSVSSKIHECTHCTYKTTIVRNFNNHSCKIHMQNQPGAEDGCEIKTCNHCNATFRTKRNLDQHIIMKHPDFIAEVTSKIYECAHCAFKTTRNYYLSKHMLTHTWAESACKLKKCVHCNATFKTKMLLGNHIITKHPGFIASVSGKIHECNHCTYKTTFKGKLAIHVLKHPGAKSSYKLNVCIYCDATFINKKSLNDHIIKKHPEHTASVSGKILECQYCTFKTTLNGCLTRHMGKHPEAKGGYALKTCIHCNAAFKSKRSLDDHTIKKHPEYISSVSSKLYECTHCTYKTTVKRDLDSHLSKIPKADGSGKLIKNRKRK